MPEALHGNGGHWLLAFAFGSPLPIQSYALCHARLPKLHLPTSNPLQRPGARNQDRWYMWYVLSRIHGEARATPKRGLWLVVPSSLESKHPRPVCSWELWPARAQARSRVLSSVSLEGERWRCLLWKAFIRYVLVKLTIICWVPNDCLLFWALLQIYIFRTTGDLSLEVVGSSFGQGSFLAFIRFTEHRKCPNMV